jgi:hypothetical protein
MIHFVIIHHFGILGDKLPMQQGLSMSRMRKAGGAEI